ncbi:PTPA-domain-containing protein [Schizopora paradoxa]|uniref:Serine/threonine-protein phosphatase 2A activator n=1 Tax=Schizopora paradoxa TaxID=27342 RepID=A0A0H2S0F1_9AGAM|nr:PTPA-domain-containing protein [Schizopora paradoxa]
MALPEILTEQITRLGLPSLKIRSDEDLVAWKSTMGYRNYMLFLHRLTDSVVGWDIPRLSDEDPSLSPAIRGSLKMLERLDSWINEIPPQVSPQRFGNLAFRTWGKKLEDNANNILKELLPERLHVCVPLLEPYLVISFGSFTRMDYGTGHEAAFALLLLCLSLVRFFQPEPQEERNLVLVVFLRYLRLCWRLQDVYKLEPAGSHGVWGLDDSSFLGYVFGSGQLRERTDIPVSSVLRRPLPPTNLYYLSVSRIHEVKSGPFHEHSSQLYSIATGVPNWMKVNSGLFKMYEAEVLGKRVVVQHIPVGGLLEWDSDTNSETKQPSIDELKSSPAPLRAPWSQQSPTTTFRLPPATRTQAPWAASRAAINTAGSGLIPTSFATNSMSMPGTHGVTLLSPSPRSSQPSTASTTGPSSSQTSLHSSPQLAQTNALTFGLKSTVEDGGSELASSTRPRTTQDSI